MIGADGSTRNIRWLPTGKVDFLSGRFSRQRIVLLGDQYAVFDYDMIPNGVNGPKDAHFISAHFANSTVNYALEGKESVQ